jgi:hypothetical protein
MGFDEFVMIMNKTDIGEDVGLDALRPYAREVMRAALPTLYSIVKICTGDPALAEESVVYHQDRFHRDFLAPSGVLSKLGIDPNDSEVSIPGITYSYQTYNYPSIPQSFQEKTSFVIAESGYDISLSSVDPVFNPYRPLPSNKKSKWGTRLQPEEYKRRRAAFTKMLSPYRYYRVPHINSYSGDLGDSIQSNKVAHSNMVRLVSNSLQIPLSEAFTWLKFFTKVTYVINVVTDEKVTTDVSKTVLPMKVPQFYYVDAKGDKVVVPDEEALKWRNKDFNIQKRMVTDPGVRFVSKYETTTKPLVPSLIWPRRQFLEDSEPEL